LPGRDGARKRGRHMPDLTVNTVRVGRSGSLTQYAVRFGHIPPTLRTAGRTIGCPNELSQCAAVMAAVKKTQPVFEGSRRRRARCDGGCRGYRLERQRFSMPAAS
jgi:hypothetical protein